MTTQPPPNRPKLLALVMSLALLVSSSISSVGCAHGASAAQRRECRQLRGRAVARVIGMTLGAVVVVGVVIAAAATSGSTPNFGGGGRRSRRSQARREARWAACRDTGPASPSDSTPSAAPVAAPSPTVVEFSDVADIPIVPVENGPPSVEELDAAIQPHADAVRLCHGPNAGTLFVDARLDGATGSVVGVLLHGPAAEGVAPSCVYHALDALRVHPFDGVVDVRWAIDMAGAAH
ncbi:MAG: hypothetical protein H6726_10695 [Sandaracinaceae bacterium]|nr:hypothetical protein [Myxococcales bacterium]MCB9658105.1 hypothetical protein [Sandaracinaceae bacterium]